MSEQQRRQALYRYRLTNYWCQTTEIENALGAGFDSRLHPITVAGGEVVSFSLESTLKLRHQERLKQVSESLQDAWLACRFELCA